MVEINAVGMEVTSKAQYCFVMRTKYRVWKRAEGDISEHGVKSIKAISWDVPFGVCI